MCERSPLLCSLSLTGMATTAGCGQQDTALCVCLAGVARSIESDVDNLMRLISVANVIPKVGQCPTIVTGTDLPAPSNSVPVPCFSRWLYAGQLPSVAWSRAPCWVLFRNRISSRACAESQMLLDTVELPHCKSQGASQPCMSAIVCLPPAARKPDGVCVPLVSLFQTT